MENKEVQTGLELDLRHIVAIVYKRLWAILLSGALLGGLALSYAVFFITPTYSSSVMFYVNNQVPESPGFSSSQVTAAQELARTYMVILKTRTVLEMVNEKAGLNYSYAQLQKMVSAETVNETDVFSVRITSTNPSDAYQLAKALEQVLPDKINSEVEGSSLRMVDGAVQTNIQVGPNYSQYAMLGAIAGAAICLLIVVVADIMDTTIHTEEYLSTAFEDVPLLAVIPPAEGSDKHNATYYGKKPSQADGRREAKK